MAFRDYLPFQQGRRPKTPTLSAIAQDPRAGSKLFKAASLALGDGSGWGPRAQFEHSPYDFDRIIQAVDTDSFVKQAFNKYKELLWKEGWDLVGENDESIVYIHERLDLMEFVMRRPFQDLLVEIGDQLAKFSNCFVIKVRADIDSWVSRPLRQMDRPPVAGYYVLPAETVLIKRDANNQILGYTQEGVVTANGEQPPVWEPQDVIHFTIDKKPGRVFGTPFMVSVMDDVVALRQMEEDIQNLVHKELIPLYKYKVGTEAEPADDAEVARAAMELDNLRAEGGLVLPERHDVEVIGAEGSALDASPYLHHHVTRVIMGLGLAPHHLGYMSEGGNRSVTDRLDIALYDKIKTYQRYLSGMIRLHILTELLFEGGFDPITPPSDEGISDRVLFRFREIDVDTQVKKETHEMQKWTQNVATYAEVRLALNLPPDADQSELLAALQARIQMEVAENQAEVQAKHAPPITATTPTGGTKAIQPPTKPDAAKPATKGQTNVPNNTKGVGNQVRPSNQFGRRTSPNVRHSEAINEVWLDEVASLLEEDE